MPRTKSQKKKSKSKSANMRSRSLTIVSRDPYESENSVNKGDLPMIPAGWRYPRVANQSYKIVRTVNSLDISQIASNPVFGSYNFKLSDLPNYTEFTALFDQYRLGAARIKFRPRFNTATVTLITTAVFPRLLTVIDYDDSVNPSILNDMLQYQTLKETRFDMDHVRLVKPRMALAAFAASVFTSFANAKDMWIDCASPAVEHYGVKFGIEAGLAGQTVFQTWAVEIEYFFEFRQTR